MMDTTLHIIHWISGLIVMAESLNKLERTAPFAPGMTLRARLVDGLKSIAWFLLALGAGGALAGPLLDDMFKSGGSAGFLLHQHPSLSEVLVITGFAVLIVRTRVKEG